MQIQHRCLIQRTLMPVLTLLFVVLLATPQAILQAAPTPTPQQMEMFRQLSPAQQAQAMQLFQQEQNKSTKQTSFQGAQPIAQPTPQTIAPRETKTDAALEGRMQVGTEAVSLKNDKQEKEIKQALKQFGYDLFSGTPTTFAPAIGIPIPSNYIVGPGDTIQVQLFGKENADYDLVVSREGKLRFPGIGPISVAGVSFEKLTQSLQKRIKRQMIGVKANITMGTLRSIRIFVLGDAIRPGSYTISALSNMTNALFVSGGIQPIGSLRNIQLKRRGEIITELDLYDLLLNGDTSGDQRLQPGDVIFIPPIGKTIGVAGEVRRPAIYELKSELKSESNSGIKKEQSIKDAIRFAGGLLPTAYPKESQLERITKTGLRTLINIDATVPKNLNLPLQDGDVFRVYSILEKMEDIVMVSGHVQRPGGLQWKKGMKLTDAIPSIDDLLPKPDLSYVLIKREQGPDRHIEVITTRIDKALADSNSAYNTLLNARDEIRLFGIGEDRQKSVEPLIEQLKQQARYNQPALIASIEGSVHFPGTYPLYQGMRVGDLIRAAFDIKPKTDMNYALVSRQIDGGERIKAFSFSLKDIINQSEPEAELELKPQDTVYIFSIEDDIKPATSSRLEDDNTEKTLGTLKIAENRQALIKPIIKQLLTQTRQGKLSQVVTITGYVNAPGRYPLEHEMRVSDLIIAAGQLKESAYTLNAELSRYDIVDGEKVEIAHFTINSSDIFNGNVVNNIELKPYDHLHIKQVPHWQEAQMVELVGEVVFPGVYPFRRGETLNDVLIRAGGLTDQSFPQGAIFVREELKQKEQEQIDIMAARLESDLAAAKLERAQDMTKTPINSGDDSISLADSLLKQLRSTKAVGRLVIDLPEIIKLKDTYDSEDEDEYEVQYVAQDLRLKDGDKLYVPTKMQEVTIIGEVQKSTSHLYSRKLDRDDYINMSGGMTYKADDDRIYIVRANGAVVSDKNSGWFGGGKEVRAGDTIVVPLDADRMSTLTLWTNITQIVYQLGVAAAAYNSIGVFN